MRLAALLALAACGQGERGSADREAARELFRRVSIEAPPGISDLTVDDRGVMWAIAERDRQVLEIELVADTPRITVHPLDGVPDGFDTEAIAWLGRGRFVIGAEGLYTPTAAVLFGELRAGRLVVTQTQMLSSSELGVELTANHGIEAVCGNGEEVLAATETVGKLPDGTRYASLARLSGDAITVAQVRLTSDRGKLSAMHCTFGSDGAAQVIAIERHFGVARILRFVAARNAVEITPKVELDLHPILRDTLNLEGIVRLPDGRLVAINDNQSKVVKGPTQLLVFAPR